MFSGFLRFFLSLITASPGQASRSPSIAFSRPTFSPKSAFRVVGETTPRHSHAMRINLIYQISTAIFPNQHHAIFEGHSDKRAFMYEYDGKWYSSNLNKEYLLHCPPLVLRGSTTRLFLETIVRAWSSVRRVRTRVRFEVGPSPSNNPACTRVRVRVKYSSLNRVQACV